MVVELLSDLQVKDFLFECSLQQDFQLVKDGKVLATSAGDRVLTKKIRHYCNWSLVERRSVSFFQTVFVSSRPGEAFARKFDIVPIDPSDIKIGVSKLVPYEEVIFSGGIMDDLLSNVDDAIVVSEAEPLDEPGPKVLYVNKTFQSMTGFSSKEIVGQSPRILQGKNTCQEQREIVKNALKSWEPAKVTLVNYRPNGEEFWVELKIVPVKDETGWWTHWIALQSDVTERVLAKKAQDAVLEMHKRYLQISSDAKAFFDYLLESVLCLTDSEFGFIGEVRHEEAGKYLETFSISDISWDEETRTAYEKLALKGMEFRNLDTLFGLVIKDEQPLLTNDPSSHVTAGGLPTGHPPLDSFMGVPLFSSGRCVGMVGVANREQGYTDEMLSAFSQLFNSMGELIGYYLLEKDSLQKQEQADSVLNQIGVGLWELDLVTQSLAWDDTMYSLFGIKKENFSGHYDAWERSLHPDDKEASVRILEEAIAERKPLDMIFRIINGVGEIRHIQARGQILLDASGNPKNVKGINWDVSPMVHAREELERERRFSMHQGKLASLGELAAGVGHEINNPLAISVGNGLMIRKTLKNHGIEVPELDDALIKQEMANERIKRIVDGLRIFARDSHSHVEVFDVEKAIQINIDLVGEIYLKDGIRIELDCGRPKFIRANQGEFQQIVMNIMSNARDALVTTGGGTIQIKIAEAGESIVISIQDNGSGIAEDVQKRIFEPFFTTKEVGTGTGLGLGLVQRMVERAKGAITVESEQGRGTVFFLRFPAASEESLSAEKMSSKEVKLKEAASGAKILFVDDEEEIREVARFFLEEEGFAVEEARSAEEAIGKPACISCSILNI